MNPAVETFLRQLDKEGINVDSLTQLAPQCERLIAQDILTVEFAAIAFLFHRTLDKWGDNVAIEPEEHKKAQEILKKGIPRVITLADSGDFEASRKALSELIGEYAKNSFRWR